MRGGKDASLYGKLLAATGVKKLNALVSPIGFLPLAGIGAMGPYSGNP